MRLAQLLSDYQSRIGNTGPQVDSSLARLADQPCVVGGQQVALMGGPCMVFYKALTTLLVAQELNAVPIFWAATEDHDVDEVSSATLLGPRGDLERYRVSLPRGHFVEDIPLTPDHRAVIDRFCERLEISLPPLGDLYGEAQVRILADAFRNRGLLFLEPRLLRPLAPEFFQKAISTDIASLIDPEGPLNPHATHVFYKDQEGRRLPYREGVPLDRLSTGAALRPLLQSLVLPTIAYVAGPTEIVYHRQLTRLFAHFDVEMPRLIPRLSHTFEPPGLSAHARANLLRPRSKPQERVISWWQFPERETLFQMSSDATVS